MELMKKERTYDDYKTMVEDWARTDARFIKERGEGREKWERIRRDTIMGWKLSERQGQSELRKRRLYVLYVNMVNELAPTVIKTAPAKPSIAVSTI